MTVKPKENSRSFQMPPLRQMHAPMKVFVNSVINGTRNQRTANQAPISHPQRRPDKRKLPHRDKQRAVPPRHRNRMLVLLVHQMIRVIGAKYPVMRQRVPRKWIAEDRQMFVHQEAVQGPFEEGAEDATNSYSHRAPEDELHLTSISRVYGARTGPKRENFQKVRKGAKLMRSYSQRRRYVIRAFVRS